MVKLAWRPKLDAKERAIAGRFIGAPIVKWYRSRLERGSIVQPIELTRLAKADAKRSRRAQRRTA